MSVQCAYLIEGHEKAWSLTGEAVSLLDGWDGALQVAG